VESIGEILKQRRIEKGLTLAGAHEATKVTMQNLAALEEDRFDAFPNRVYARAFLRDYANFLGLESGELLQRYEETWAAPTVVLAPARRPWPVAAGIALAVIVVLGISATTWYYMTQGRPTGVAVERPPLPPEATKPPPVPPPPVTTPGTQPTEIVLPQKPAKVRVAMRVLARTWISVSMDGARGVAQTLWPGGQASFIGQKSVYVHIGNAGGLDLTVNGKHIGRLGASGQVVKRTFGPEPVSTP